jgi:hypothetical protein
VKKYSKLVQQLLLGWKKEPTTALQNLLAGLSKQKWKQLQSDLGFAI